MVGGAGRSEGSWEGDQHDLLVCELLVGNVVGWESAHLGVGGGPRNVLELD